MKQRCSSIAAAVLVMVFFASWAGCGDSDQKVQSQSTVKNQASNKPLIAATNLPLKSMTQRIVGDFAEVIQPQVEAESGQGLNVEEVLRLQNADIVFTNGPGANDAAWLDLISLDAARVHATTGDEFELSDFIQVEDFRTVHSHGDEGEHSHPWLVPQSWLNPSLAKAQSTSILNHLIKTFPEEEDSFRERYRNLKDQLSELERLAIEVAELLKANKVRVLASDPRLLFFTRSLNLEDDYLMWFDLPESSTAIEELQKRLPEPSTNEKNSTLLLWSQDAGSLEQEIGDAIGVKSASISLIESGKSDLSNSDVEFVAQLRENFETVKAVLEEMND